MAVKVALFDFDGTLADTLPLAFRSFQSVFAKYDQRIVTKEELVKMFGPTEDGILSANLANATVLADATRHFYDVYKQDHRQVVHPHPDILSLLQTLKEHGIRIGVITGKSRRAYEISAEALEMAPFFDLVITGDDVERPKPDPEGVLKAMTTLNGHKEDTIFLGDSIADVKAGQAAGVRTFAVQWLSTSQSSEFELSPEHIYRTVPPFLDWVFGENKE
ncbi:HAD family hydrolase [Gorillibacterium massiliense]|uniref:HAD family hydrolase n=1 Tax=Gorillibacterium massiliense TaxID=1280390 RepID=UPI0004AEEE44|nr:HAD family hydrolase [Gorillibacterium massiliense]